jgi:hypothetical protein
VIDGAPGLGDDLGGLLAVLPAAALLVAMVAGLRVTAARVAGVLIGAVVLAVGLGAVDYARPAAEQTHAGRFVGQVLHGGAWQVVHRRVDAVLGSFSNPVVTALVIVVLVAAVVRSREREPAGLPAAVAAAVVVGLLGIAVNDSGVFVGAAVALAFVPPVLATRGLTASRGILDSCEHDRGRTRAAGRDRAAPARRSRARFAPPPPRGADRAAVRAHPRRGRPRS